MKIEGKRIKWKSIQQVVHTEWRFDPFILALICKCSTTSLTRPWHIQPPTSLRKQRASDGSVKATMKSIIIITCLLALLISWIGATFLAEEECNDAKKSVANGTTNLTWNFDDVQTLVASHSQIRRYITSIQCFICSLRRVTVGGTCDYFKLRSDWLERQIVFDASYSYK